MKIKLTTENFDNVVLNSDKLVIVDFWAEWCGPCRTISSSLDEISNEFQDKVVVTKCNVDECPQVAARFSIRNIPTILYFKNGLAIDKQVGAMPKSSFVNKINTLLQ